MRADAETRARGATGGAGGPAAGTQACRGPREGPDVFYAQPEARTAFADDFASHLAWLHARWA